MLGSQRFADAEEEKYLYRAKPAEQDANAAASTYLLARFGDEPSKRLHVEPWYGLVWSFTGPESVETLVSRSVCFLFQYADLCEAQARKEGTTFDVVLEQLSPQAGALWRTLGAG